MASEMGTDMSRFGDADHLSSWAGVSSGNHVSANKRYSGRTAKGNRPLRNALNQAAHAAAKVKNTYLSAQYRRLATRIGKKKAIVALEHSILVAAYHIIKNNEVYQDLGGDYFDRINSQTKVHRMVKRLENLGYKVTLEQCQPQPKAA